MSAPKHANAARQSCVALRAMTTMGRPRGRPPRPGWSGGGPPPTPCEEDVYISAARVRRCELVSGDRVAGPVRTPRRSERYPSLVRIDTTNGASADEVADGARYEDLPVAWPSERLARGSDDKTLEAIDWLTPLGKGSRATSLGPLAAGNSAPLRRLHAALKNREGLEASVVLIGVRPEE